MTEEETKKIQELLGNEPESERERWLQHYLSALHSQAISDRIARDHMKAEIQAYVKEIDQLQRQNAGLLSALSGQGPTNG